MRRAIYDNTDEEGCVIYASGVNESWGIRYRDYGIDDQRRERLELPHETILGGWA